MRGVCYDGDLGVPLLEGRYISISKLRSSCHRRVETIVQIVYKIIELLEWRLNKLYKEEVKIF